MSSTFVSDSTDSREEDNTVIILVSQDGRVTVDQSALQQLLSRQPNAAVSVVRLNATEDGDTDNPTVNVTVEQGYSFPPAPEVEATEEHKPPITIPQPEQQIVDGILELDPEQIQNLETALQSEQAKEILGENVAAILGQPAPDSQNNIHTLLTSGLNTREYNTFIMDTIYMDHSYFAQTNAGNDTDEMEEDSSSPTPSEDCSSTTGSNQGRAAAGNSKHSPIRRSQRQMDRMEREQADKIRAENEEMLQREKEMLRQKQASQLPIDEKADAPTSIQVPVIIEPTKSKTLAAKSSKTALDEALGELTEEFKQQSPLKYKKEERARSVSSTDLETASHSKPKSRKSSTTKLDQRDDTSSQVCDSVRKRSLSSSSNKSEEKVSSFAPVTPVTTVPDAEPNITSDERKYPKRENRKLPAHLSDIALFSTPDIMRRVGEERERERAAKMISIKEMPPVPVVLPVIIPTTPLKLSAHPSDPRLAKREVKAPEVVKPEVKPIKRRAKAPGGNGSDGESDSDNSWKSEDDPDRLWCICKKPHNNRFMICCDKCEDWFHGKCVGITKAMGDDLESKGGEWVCPPCRKLPKEPKPTEQKEIGRKREKPPTSIKQPQPSPVKPTQNKPTLPVADCFVCQTKPVRSNSIYCSNECILKHASESLTTKKPPSANKIQPPPSAAGRPDERVVVFDPTSGNLLTGPSAPTRSTLEGWLQVHPMFQVVKGGELPASKFYGVKKTAPAPPKAPLPRAPVGERPKLTLTISDKLKPHVTGHRSKLIPKTAVVEAPKIGPSDRLKLVKSDSIKSSIEKSKATSSAEKAKILSTLTMPKVLSPAEKARALSTELKLHKVQVPKLPSTPVETKPKKILPKPRTPSVSSTSKSEVTKKTPDIKKTPETTELQAPEPIRLTVRKALKEALTGRITEAPDLKDKNITVEKTVTDVEEELYQLYKDVGVKYRSKYRSLVFNIKDAKNEGLFRQILLEQVSAKQLVRMSPEELASKELAEWREREAKHQLEMVERTEKERLILGDTYVLKTHKGEVEIEKADVAAVSELVVATTTDDKVKEGIQADVAETKKASLPKDKAYEHRSHVFDSLCSICTGKHGKHSSSSKSSTTKSSRDKTRHDNKRSRNKDRDRHRGSRKDRDRDKKKSSKDKEREKGREKEKEIKKEPKPEKIVIQSTTPSPIPVVAVDINKIEFDLPDNLLAETEDIVDSIIAEDSDGCDKEPSSTVTIKTPDSSEDLPKGMVWQGSVYMPEVSRFSVQAYEVSGKAANIFYNFPSSIEVVGRILPDVMWEYISKMKKSGTKDIVVFRLQPQTKDEKVAYLSFYSYLSTRNRFGVVGNAKDKVKDFYILPLPSHQPIPQVLLPLDGPGFEDYRPHMLLGIIICSRQKRPSSNKIPYEPEAKIPRISVPVSQPVSTEIIKEDDLPDRSYTPPLPTKSEPSTTPPPLSPPPVPPPPPIISDRKDNIMPLPPQAPQKRIVTLKPQALKSEQSDMYSPSDNEPDPVKDKKAEVAKEHQLMMAELNRRIEEQKKEICDIAGGMIKKEGSDDENSAYSPPDMSFTPPPILSVTNINTEHISFPANIKEILESINNKKSYNMDSDPIIQNFAVEEDEYEEDAPPPGEPQAEATNRDPRGIRKKIMSLSSLSDAELIMKAAEMERDQLQLQGNEPPPPGIQNYLPAPTNIPNTNMPMPGNFPSHVNMPMPPNMESGNMSMRPAYNMLPPGMPGLPVPMMGPPRSMPMQGGMGPPGSMPGNMGPANMPIQGGMGPPGSMPVPGNMGHGNVPMMGNVGPPRNMGPGNMPMPGNMGIPRLMSMPGNMGLPGNMPPQFHQRPGPQFNSPQYQNYPQQGPPPQYQQSYNEYPEYKQSESQTYGGRNRQLERYPNNWRKGQRDGREPFNRNHGERFGNRRGKWRDDRKGDRFDDRQYDRRRHSRDREWSSNYYKHKNDQDYDERHRHSERYRKRQGNSKEYEGSESRRARSDDNKDNEGNEEWEDYVDDEGQEEHEREEHLDSENQEEKGQYEEGQDEPEVHFDRECHKDSLDCDEQQNREGDDNDDERHTDKEVYDDRHEETEHDHGDRPDHIGQDEEKVHDITEEMSWKRVDTFIEEASFRVCGDERHAQKGSNDEVPGEHHEQMDYVSDNLPDDKDDGKFHNNPEVSTKDGDNFTEVNLEDESLGMLFVDK